MFKKKTLTDIDVAEKYVLVSVDFNVPGDDSGQVTDDYRIKAALPTIQYLREQKSRIVIISHRGRPEGKPVTQFSLRPVAEKLSGLLGADVAFAEECVGDKAAEAKKAVQPGGVLVLENTRFHPEEEANDAQFAAQLADGMDVFVQDAFGNAHRKHASTDAVAKLLPSVAGLLLAREVEAITSAMESSRKPLITVIGGAKISDKIDVLRKFVEISDFVAVVGAMANTFLLAQGHAVGVSLAEPDAVDTAKEILQLAEDKAKKQRFTFFTPCDIVVSTQIDGTQPTRIVDVAGHTFADITTYPKQPPEAAYTVAHDENILDIGPMSAAFIAGAIKLSATAIWNGAAGVTETPGLAGAAAPFEHATRVIVDALIGSGKSDPNRPHTVVGGGDTIAYVQSKNLQDDFDHVSSGGGASLELMAGRELPAVAVLQDKW